MDQGTTVSDPIAIIWYRRDLRTDDHAGLATACSRNQRVVPIYVQNEGEMGDWSLGAVSRWWLHHSLESLSSELVARGSFLYIQRGTPSEVLVNVARLVGATNIYFQRRTEPAARAVEIQVENACAQAGIETCASDNGLFFAPGTVATGQGNPYQVFTPFWKRCLQQG